MSGPEKTALPLYSTLVGSSYQDDPNLTFSYTIDAGTFTAGTEGQRDLWQVLKVGVAGVEGEAMLDDEGRNLQKLECCIVKTHPILRCLLAQLASSRGGTAFTVYWIFDLYCFFCMSLSGYSGVHHCLK